MNDQERSDQPPAVESLCERYPHWRFGQLGSNLAGLADTELWDAEDSQLLDMATAHRVQLNGQERKVEA